MRKINKGNLRKTVYYLKRNGLHDTFYAALERLRKNETDSYTYTKLPKEEWEAQHRWSVNNQSIKFSIVVPVYHTSEQFFKAMLESVLHQSYPNFEVLLADAGKEEEKRKLVESYRDERLIYIPLDQNGGISENTNAVLSLVTGTYTGLLDHDDLLTEDALYEMAVRIYENASTESDELRPLLYYSDEDKCDETGKHFFEPHIKPEFNLDLILSNNYICHFCVLDTKMLQSLRLRKEFDGAQDHDLMLRSILYMGGYIAPTEDKEQTYHGQGMEASLSIDDVDTRICHISKVLYHWRCHSNSTAANPASKQYAYDAGGRAIQNFLDALHIEGEVTETSHLGFFCVRYEEDLLIAREDLGAIGGKILTKNKITGGIYTKNGTCPYERMKDVYSGYMHRATIKQDAYAVDIRIMRIKTELLPVVKKQIAESLLEIYGPGYTDPLISIDENHRIDINKLSLNESQFHYVSVKICEKIQESGYRILWDPDWTD